MDFKQKEISSIIKSRRPLPYFDEHWQDTYYANRIDTTFWEATDPGAGVAWAFYDGVGEMAVRSVPNALNSCRLRTLASFPIARLTDDNFSLRKLCFEFMAAIGTIANVDNAVTFLGLTWLAGDDRTSNNLCGFGLLADAYQSITDSGGTEQTNTGFGVAANALNTLKLEVSREQVGFFINGVRVALHTTLGAIPTVGLMLNFYMLAEAGGVASLEIGHTRAWAEDIPEVL